MISEAVRRLNPAIFGPPPAPPLSTPDDGPPTAYERDLQRACEAELSRRGVWFLHLSPRAREKAGCPDLIFAHPKTGQFCGVELKTATGRLKGKQAPTLADIAKSGGRVAVIRTYEAFVQFLDT